VNGPRYRLTIEPARSNVPVPQRLRALLKYALRACNLRCLAVEELPPAPADLPQDAAQRPGGSEASGKGDRLA
jgi:hypothetical protein